MRVLRAIRGVGVDEVCRAHGDGDSLGCHLARDPLLDVWAALEPAPGVEGGEGDLGTVCLLAR